MTKLAIFSHCLEYIIEIFYKTISMQYVTLNIKLYQQFDFLATSVKAILIKH